MNTMMEDCFPGLNLMDDFMNISQFAKDMTPKEQKQVLILHGVVFLGVVALVALSRIFC